MNIRLLRFALLFVFLAFFAVPAFSAELREASFAVKNKFKARYNVKWEDATLEAQEKFLNEWNKDVLDVEKQDKNHKKELEKKLRKIQKVDLEHEKLIISKKKEITKKEIAKKKEASKRKQTLSKKKLKLSKNINKLRKKSAQFHNKKK